MALPSATLQISALLPIRVDGQLRLLGKPGGVALYAAKTGLGQAKVSVANAMPYETTLFPLPDLSFANVAFSSAGWPMCVVPQWLPTVPDWALGVAADASLTLAIQAFGGASNGLLLGAVQLGSLLVTRYADAAEYTSPQCVRGIAPATAAQATATAVGDGQELLWFAPHPHKPVAPLVAAQSGVVFQDSDDGRQLSLVYRQCVASAPLLSAQGAPLGKVKLLTFDTQLNSSGYAMPIINTDSVAEFAVDRKDGVYCLLVATADGAQVMLCNTQSEVSELVWPADALGPGHTLGSPTLVAAPTGSGDASFLLAFTEMADERALGLRLGVVSYANAE